MQRNSKDLLDQSLLNSVMSGNIDLDKKIKEWLQWDRVIISNKKRNKIFYGIC